MDLSVNNSRASVTTHVLKSAFRDVVSKRLSSFTDLLTAQNLIDTINFTLDALKISDSLLPLTIALGP